MIKRISILCLLTASALAGGTAQLQGPFLSGGGGSSTLPGNVVTNFITLAGVTNIAAQNDVNFAVAAEYTAGVWGSVVEAAAFSPRFNSSSHKAIVGNPWVSTNEAFGLQGLRFQQTNQTTTITLPVALTNFTVSILFKQDAVAWMNSGSANGIQYKNGLLSICNTNTLDSVNANGGEQNSAWSITTSLGNSFRVTPISTINNGSNAVWELRAGCWAQGTQQAPVFWTVRTISFNGTNGTCSAWFNGKPSVFYVSGGSSATNLMLMQSVSNLTTLVIGDCGGAWHGAGGTTFTNSYYTDIAGVIVHNISCESNTNIAAADFKFLTDLLPGYKYTEFIGSSRMWHPANTISYGGAAAIPFTNEWTSLYAQLRSDELVVNEAYPGSQVADYTNSRQLGTPSITFIPAATYIDAAKYTDRWIKTCSGDNDIGNGAANQGLTITNFMNFYGPVQTNGTKIGLFMRVGGANSSAVTNAQIRAYYLALARIFPVAAVYDEAIVISSNYLAACAYDILHVGGTNTIVGYNAAMDDALFVSGQSRPQYNSAYYQVSSQPPPQAGWSSYGYSVLDSNGLSFTTWDGSGFTNIPLASYSAYLRGATVPIASSGAAYFPLNGTVTALDTSAGADGTTLPIGWYTMSAMWYTPLTALTTNIYVTLGSNTVLTPYQLIIAGPMAANTIYNTNSSAVFYNANSNAVYWFSVTNNSAATMPNCYGTVSLRGVK
jgi:hypothetical protein